MTNAMVQVGIDIALDAARAVAGLGDVGDAAQGMGDELASANRDVTEHTNRLASAADGADGMATKTGIMTGALGALSGGLDAVGLGEYAGLLQSTAVVTDVVSGASDLLTLALESEKVQTIAATAASIGASAASKAWAAAQWLLNAALTANPIGLVIAGIAALVGGFILAYKHSETFRDIVHGALHIAGDAADWLLDKIHDFSLPWRIEFAIVKKVIEEVVNAVEDLVGWLGKIHVPDLGKVASKVNPGNWFDRPGAPPLDPSGTPPATYNVVINGVLDGPDAARKIAQVLYRGGAILGQPVLP